MTNGILNHAIADSSKSTVLISSYNIYRLYMMCNFIYHSAMHSYIRLHVYKKIKLLCSQQWFALDINVNFFIQKKTKKTFLYSSLQNINSQNKTIQNYTAVLRFTDLFTRCFTPNCFAICCNALMGFVVGVPMDLDCSPTPWWVESGLVKLMSFSNLLTCSKSQESV